jgi:hypothetical protein
MFSSRDHVFSAQCCCKCMLHSDLHAPNIYIR